MVSRSPAGQGRVRAGYMRLRSAHCNPIRLRSNKFQHECGYPHCESKAGTIGPVALIAALRSTPIGTTKGRLGFWRG
jgi:hypothetical protein